MTSSTYRTLDLTVISAEDLKDVNFFSRLQVYAEAALSGEERSRQRTPTDRAGTQNPNWNSTLRFAVPFDAAKRSINLVITLHAERALGDRLVGDVQIPIKELLAESASTSVVRRLSYQVRTPSGRAKGVLNLSYKFCDSVSYTAAATGYPPQTKLDGPAVEPVTAYPVYPPYPSPAAVYPPASAATAFASQAPPPGYPMYEQTPQAYGYGAAPLSTAGNGYPVPAYGAHPPQTVKPPKKNKLGLGLGVGLLGGALGGLIIGDAIGDAVAYDAGYDAGFDDAGFDFGF